MKVLWCAVLVVMVLAVGACNDPDPGDPCGPPGSVWSSGGHNLKCGDDGVWHK